jgi:FMN reductase (NADPH)
MVAQVAPKLKNMQTRAMPSYTAPMNLDPRLSVFANHRTIRKYKPAPLEPGHFEQILHCAQHAPTDATAQMYSFVRLTDPDLKARVAQITNNPHIATAAEALIVCADVNRLQHLLEHRGYEFGSWSAVAVHFGIGDAVLAAQTMLHAAECLGYQGCWIGGVLSALEEIIELCALPKGVLPFAGLTIGVPDESPAQRPRIQPELVLHQNQYRLPQAHELETALQRMAAITARGDWAQTLSRYFAKGGTMEAREITLRRALGQQGFDHVGDLETLFVQAEAAGYGELVLKRLGDGFQVWLNRPEWAYSGEGATPRLALEQALKAAVAGVHR